MTGLVKRINAPVAFLAVAGNQVSRTLLEGAVYRKRR